MPENRKYDFCSVVVIQNSYLINEQELESMFCTQDQTESASAFKGRI